VREGAAISKLERELVESRFLYCDFFKSASGMSSSNNISLDFPLALARGGVFGLSSASFMVKAIAGTWEIWTYRNGEVVETGVKTVD
jgi:hypothetical protein